jgi:single-stranded-DNA-specific exonuclease
MKKWDIVSAAGSADQTAASVLAVLLANRGLKNEQEIESFLHPFDPYALTPVDVGINPADLKTALARIQAAISADESIVVYADYDADGITAGAIMWETLHHLGARVMPYIPHRVEEGYGFSRKGIDIVNNVHHPTLLISVDHGITAHEKIAYARSLGIDVVVTDHHVKPAKLPDCAIVHTTQLCGAGISWFVSKSLLNQVDRELLALAAIGTIADMVPLTGACRAIAAFGIAALNQTKRLGLLELITDAGLTPGAIGTYEISHILAPRLNAMGRLVHALDALRLLCTTQHDKAAQLARTLALTNKERQLMTEQFAQHAHQLITRQIEVTPLKKLLFISDPSYNQGVIGLVAGKLVETYYRPAIVLAQGAEFSKASARSIKGFNIIEAIRSCSELLVDAGGHPMAAGFTVQTDNIAQLQQKLETLADLTISQTQLQRTLTIDCELSTRQISRELWELSRQLTPFGIGNSEPIFVTRELFVSDVRLVGKEGKHLKLRLSSPQIGKYQPDLEAIAFGMGAWYAQLHPGTQIDIAYTIDLNLWNGTSTLQLKVKDLKLPEKKIRVHN